jgi:hypothetical protein
MGEEGMWRGAMEYLVQNAGGLGAREAIDLRDGIINVLESMGDGLGQGVEQGLRDIGQGGRIDGILSRAEYVRDSALNTRRIFNELSTWRTVQGDLYQGMQNLRGDMDMLARLGLANLQGLHDAGFRQEPRDAVQDEGYRPGEDPNVLLNRILQMIPGNEENKNQIRAIIDADGNGNVDAGELQSAFNDNSIINRMGELNPVISRMFKDPNFRSRTIQKLPSQSIYKDVRPSSNQVNEVLQGYALYEQDENFFNVNF